MRKLILTAAAVLAAASAGYAAPKALYVKKGDAYTKYNFGVAGDLHFQDGGKTLLITGYSDAIKLDDIDYITFNAPVDKTALTPTAQKEKLVKIGEEAYAMVDLKKYEEALNMWHVFFDSFDTEDGGYHNAYVRYALSEEYYDVHRPATRVIRSLKALSQVDAAAAAAMREAAVDLYKASDYFGIFEADKEKGEWVKKSDADHLEIRFAALDGKMYSISLKTSAEFTTWETGDFKGEMPRTMEVSFSKEGKAFATAEIKSELQQNKSIDISINFQSNGLAVDDILKVRDDKMTDTTIVKIDGKEYLNSERNVYGRHLVDYDVMKPAIKESFHYHDEDGECMGSDPAELFSHLTRATVSADLLGRLQVSGTMVGMQKVYDTLHDYDENEDMYIVPESISGLKPSEGYYATYFNGYLTSISDDKSIIECTFDKPEDTEQKLRILANYSDANFRYDGDKKIQGYLGWDISEEVEENNYWISDTYQRGAVIIDNMVIDVTRHRDPIDYDPATDTTIYSEWGDWHYSANYHTPDGEPDWDKETLEVKVDEKDVLQGVTIRDKYLSAAPVLTFPDQTSFMFEDFFEGVGFKSLIDDYNDIINTYLNITGQDWDDEEI